MAGGLLVLYAVLHGAGTSIDGWDFTAPLLVAGIGMGMVFAPLFDIILGGVADHEIGSASGLLQAMQQLGMSLGVAVIGTVFFGLLGSHGDHAADFVGAAEYTTLLTAGLVALAFALAFLLPQRARAHEAPPAPAQLDPAFA